MSDIKNKFYTALDIGTSKICMIVAEETENNRKELSMKFFKLNIT